MKGGTRWRAASLAFAGLYIVLFALQLRVFPLWGPFATFDEQLQDYLAGRNFAEYGFARTALLSDLSSAPDPAGHPLIYNHQPPGAQLFIGVVIGLIGERYDVIRALFVALFIAGLLAYLGFLRMLDGSFLPGAAAALLLVSPRTILHMMDHPTYSLFPLFAFLPLLAIDRGARTGRWWWRGLSVILVFVGSNYLIYGPLLMVFTFWLVAGLTRLVPLTRRDLVMFGAAAAFAVTLHLLQTVIVIGPVAMLRETVFSISNRMTGHPTRKELEEFYASLGFVLYGGHEFSLVRFVAAVGKSLLFAGTVLAVIAVAVAAVIWFTPRFGGAEKRTPVVEARRLLTAAAAVFPAVIVPCFAFPAFASDYGLQGTNEFLLAIFGSSGFLLTRRIGRQLSPSGHRIIATVLAIGLATAIIVQSARIARVVRHTAVWARHPAVELGLGWVSQHLQGQVVMTNIDPMALGFLTREVAVGGCHRHALVDKPDSARCAIRLGNDVALRRAARADFYVWVGAGNAFCSPRQSCIERSELDRSYPELFSNELVAVYDLTTSRRLPGAS